MSVRKLWPADWPIPKAIRSQMGNLAGGQRFFEEDGHILLVLLTVPTLEKPEERDPAYFWCDDADQWHSWPHRGGMDALEEHLNNYRIMITFLDKQLALSKDMEERFEVLRIADPVLRATHELLEVLKRVRESRDVNILL